MTQVPGGGSLDQKASSKQMELLTMIRFISGK